MLMLMQEKLRQVFESRNSTLDVCFSDNTGTHDTFIFILKHSVRAPGGFHAMTPEAGDERRSLNLFLISCIYGALIPTE